MRKRLLLKFGLLGSVVIMSLLSGCSWHRIPEHPAYNVPSSIPVNIGVVLADSKEFYGPGVVKELREMKIFRSIVFPYKAGDPVDGVLKINISGKWHGSKGANMTKRFLIGLSLYTLSPVIGLNMSGTHDVSVSLSKGNFEISQYAMHVETPVSWGIGANPTEVMQKCNDLQRRKLAVAIADRLNSDRLIIYNELKKQ